MLTVSVLLVTHDVGRFGWVTDPEGNRGEL
jgi:hypothetical protein